jgi:hypothetical protein
VHLRERRIEGECLRRGDLGRRHREVRRLASHQGDLQSEHHPGVRDADIGEGVARIQRDRALEILDRPVAAVAAALAPEEPTLQIKLVGVAVFGLVPGQRLLLFAGQSQRERTGHAR